VEYSYGLFFIENEPQVYNLEVDKKSSDSAKILGPPNVIITKNKIF
jgi:hypothetical protein